jgi:hypothetical protein
VRRTVLVALAVESELAVGDLERLVKDWLDLKDLDTAFGDAITLVGHAIEVETPPAYGVLTKPHSQSKGPCSPREHIDDLDNPGFCLWCKKAIVRRGGAWVLLTKFEP